MSTFVPSAGGDSGLPAPRPAGAWHERRIDRLRAPQGACSCCGRPVLGRVWRAEIDGQTHDFCEARCEVLFTGYWLPRYGCPPRGED